ncbi:MAG: outer membrane protein transport protein, partial [Deltaproteobacteria bacterium]|nr:outer membrane protein transport protein [Deltaproteobacteria bacterium]
MATAALAAGSGAYRVEVPDARALALGGAFVAVADSPVAVLYNPAGMTQIKQAEISANMSLVQPHEMAHPDSTQKTKMQQKGFLIPSLFSVTPLSDKVALGVGVTSEWGLGTEWAQDSFARYVATRSTLRNEDYLITTAYQFSEQVSLGIGATIDQSTISKEKKMNQGGADANFKLDGDNTAAGFQVSGLYKLNERHQFGLQYNSDIRRKYHGKVHLDGMNAGLMGTSFPSSSYETDVVSKSTLPQSVDLGYSFKPTEKLLLSADILWMDWSSTKEEELAYPSETN